MNSANFYKTFLFNIFSFEKSHFTDRTKEPVPMHYFGCIIKGTAEIISHNKKLKLRENEIFYIPKGIKYQSRWFADDTGKVEFYSFGFEISPINRLFVLQKINCSDKAKTLFGELCQEIPITDKGIGKLYYFFGEIASGMKQLTTPTIEPTIEKVIEYISEHPELRISQVAKHCNISESGIYFLFKKNLNKTPNEVRLEILCEKAVMLLSTTNKSVEEISGLLGLSSTSYFRKILYRYIGKSPREVRKSSLQI